MSHNRARARMSGLGLGLENEEEVAPVEGGEAPVVSEQAEDTVEQEVMEVEEASEEVESAEETTEELQEASESLEAIAISLEASLEDGGIDARSAVYLNHAVNTTLKRIGVSNTGVPSLESFGGATGRLSATKVSLEGIKEWLEKIWTAIKNAVLKAVTFIKDLFAKLFGGAKKLSERAKKLKEEAAKMTGAGDKKITFRSVSKLHLKGRADAGDFLTGMKNLEDVVTTSYEVLPDLNKQLIDMYSKKMQLIAASQSAEQASSVHGEAINAAVEIAVKMMDKAKTMAAPLPGGVQFRAVADKNVTEKPEFAQLTLSPTQKFAQIKEDAEMAPLKKDQVEALLDHVIAVADIIEKKKSVTEKMVEARKEAMKDYDKAVADMKKKDFLQQGIVSWGARNITKDYSGSLSKLSAHAFGACRAALVLAEKSIAASKGGDDKK